MKRRAALQQLGKLTAALALAPACQAPPQPPQPETPRARVEPPMTQQKPQSPLVVDLTHDVICPWCRIGHHNLRVALAGWRGPAVTVRLHPYLLDASVPPEGVDLRKRLAERYGAIQLDAMFDRVTQVGAGYGLKFDFAQIRRTPDSTIAHALVLAAPLERQSDVLDAIHAAYFEHGADIGDAAVLTGCWQAAGLAQADAANALADAGARAEVRRLAEVAGRKGLHGVPHFELHGPGGDVVLQGGHGPDAIAAGLRKVAG